MSRGPVTFAEVVLQQIADSLVEIRDLLQQASGSLNKGAEQGAKAGSAQGSERLFKPKKAPAEKPAKKIVPPNKKPRAAAKKSS